MSLHRRAAKRDDVEASIVDALRACGWSIDYLSRKGSPDLLAGRGAHLVLIEVKTGKKTLNKAQVKWHGEWRGPKPLVFRSVDDALNFHRALFVDDPYREQFERFLKG